MQFLHALRLHSHSTNPIIWGCIFCDFTGKTFANLLTFYLLFLVANFLSIKIVSQKAEKRNRIPPLFSRVFINRNSPINWKLLFQMGLIAKIVSNTYESTFYCNFLIFFITEEGHIPTISALCIY